MSKPVLDFEFVVLRVKVCVYNNLSQLFLRFLITPGVGRRKTRASSRSGRPALCCHAPTLFLVILYRLPSVDLLVAYRRKGVPHERYLYVVLPMLHPIKSLKHTIVVVVVEENRLNRCNSRHAGDLSAPTTVDDSRMYEG